MGDTKVTLPEGLVTQRPKVKKGDEVLVLAGTCGDERNYVGKIRVAERSDVDYDGDIELEYTEGADGHYANSWAVVNGPVKPGDKVIVLEYRWNDSDQKVVGAVAPVGRGTPVVGGIWVDLPAYGKAVVTKWAKLEGENAKLLADGEEVAPVVHYQTGEEIKVGDRVKAQFCGLSDGTVTELAEPPYVYVKLDGRDILPHRAGAGCFPSEKLTFVARKGSELLPVGTRVKVTGAVHAERTHGETGVIDRHSDKVFTHDVLGRVLHPYHVDLDNSVSGVYAYSVEVIEDAKTEPKFKIGDKVRFVENYAHARIGQVETVVGFWSTFGPGVQVLRLTGGLSCFSTRVELVTEPMAKLRAGDELLPVGTRVRVLRAEFASEQEGRTGTIVGIDRLQTISGRPHPYDVAVDGAVGQYTADRPLHVAEVEVLGPEKAYTEAQLLEKLAGNSEALEALGLQPTQADVLTDVTVSAVKDDDGDIWIQSLELFGNLKFRLAMTEELADDWDASELRPRPFREIEGPVKVEHG